MSQRTTFFIDKKVCLICTHLVGELGKKTKSCTFKKGNTKCPAHHTKIEVGVDTDLALETFYLALQSGDVEAIITALNEAKANPKISSAVISDLQSRLFEDSASEDTIEEHLAEEAIGDADIMEAEDETDDEDDEA